jgi:hypothetical protein
MLLEVFTFRSLFKNTKAEIHDGPKLVYGSSKWLWLFAIAVTGILMRYIFRVDVVSIKQLTVGLATFSPAISGDLGSIFYIHIFLVSALLAYFPFSKLMHLGGVFLSPTRNLANNNRMVRHVNPWNDPSIKPHSYADYEDEFRQFMADADIPLEKELEPEPEPEPEETEEPAAADAEPAAANAAAEEAPAADAAAEETQAEKE